MGKMKDKLIELEEKSNKELEKPENVVHKRVREKLKEYADRKVEDMKERNEFRKKNK